MSDLKDQKVGKFIGTPMLNPKSFNSEILIDMLTNRQECQCGRMVVCGFDCEIEKEE